MKIIVYVEGRSDKDAMERLLSPLIQLKKESGTTIEFFETPDGDRKKSLLLKVPEKAVRILQNNLDAIVVAMPDLYPPDKGFPHRTAQELCDEIMKQFAQAIQRDSADSRLIERFHAFCFKHDLEALILAAHEQLAVRLGVSPLIPNWIVPVEDQNHNHPPKHIVAGLFQSHSEKYVETIDAPAILGKADYKTIAERCPQQFKPFVEFLQGN